MDSDSTANAGTTPIADRRLLRDVCRFFLDDLIALVDPGMAAALDFERLEFLGEETFDEMNAERRFDADLVARIALTEDAYRRELEREGDQRRQARLEEERWRREAGEDEDEDWEDEEDEDDEDEDYRDKRHVLVHVAFVDAPEEHLGKHFFHHSSYLYVENHMMALTIAVVLAGGPGGVEACEYSQGVAGFTTWTFHYPAFGLSGCPAEEWIAPREDRGGTPSPIATALAGWMSAGGWDGEERRRRLRQAVGAVRVNDGRRHLLEQLVERNLTPSPEPAIEKEIARILYQEPIMSAVDVALFDELLRAFFADTMALVGRFGVDHLDFQRVRFLDPDSAAPDDDPADDPAAPLLEHLVEVGRRDAEGTAVVYVQLVVADREVADERTLRRYMQLRLRFPDRQIIPVVIFLSRATGSGACICEHREKTGNEVTLRFRYYGFTVAANSPEDFLEDSRPVAWALASLMGSWKWKPPRVKLECLEKILRAVVVDLEHREILWRFVHRHLTLDAKDEARVRENLTQHAVVMRETIVGYLDQRLGPYFPPELRDRLNASEDPMEVHRLLEEVYEASVREGLVTPEEMRSEWPIN